MTWGKKILKYLITNSKNNDRYQLIHLCLTNLCFESKFSYNLKLYLWYFEKKNGQDDTGPLRIFNLGKFKKLPTRCILIPETEYDCRYQCTPSDKKLIYKKKK